MHRRIYDATALFVSIVGSLLLSSQLALAQFTQQGPKLVGAGSRYADAEQGFSVALSANGNTALVGGWREDADTGAVWVFTRTGGVWSQQGSKLVGTPPGGGQGYSVALSADGNTALIGGPWYTSDTGAAWVFTRTGGVWSQQGSQLVGTGADNGSTGAQQGGSVALSADGNTALIGAPTDANGFGAVWVFTRSGDVWSQQGSKLVGTGAVYGSDAVLQGNSVALSADGNTALVGGPHDNDFAGAVWVFTRSNGVWTQQGNKLVGTGAVSGSFGVWQGLSVALSADGNTALEGAIFDNDSVGAAWVFTRHNGVWTQQGRKLVGTGGNTGRQGYSVALSANGNTALIGGPDDNATGAIWVFTRAAGVWSQHGSKLVGTGAGDSQFVCGQGCSVALSADGNTALEGSPKDAADAGAAWVFAPPHFNMPGTHDFNSDGFSDLAWRNTNGDVAFWLMNGAAVSSSAGIVGVPGIWSIVGQRDFNGDGMADLLWHDTSGNTAMWFMNGTAVGSSASRGQHPDQLVRHWNRRLQRRRLRRHHLARQHRQCRGVADERRHHLVFESGSATCRSPGMSSGPATTTATAKAICCGATISATPRSGS